MTRRDYEGAIEREVERWPGVTVRFEEGGKHPRAVFRFGEVEQFRPYPTTPSDRRGLDAKITEVRRLLKDMGAVLMPRPKATGPKRERNPGADQRELPVGEPAPVKPDPWAVLREVRGSSLIPGPGRYSGIPMDLYHGGVEICPGPSISSSGLKLLDTCPLKYWLQSPLNPNREPRKVTRALNLGKAAHDVLGLGDAWPSAYWVEPEGYHRGHTTKWAEAIAEEQEALERGATVLSAKDAATVRAMAERLRQNDLADALFSGGEAEVTIVWQDEETGVWLRVRPDWLPHAGRFIPDYKTCEDASPRAFERAVDNYGYHQSAALYLEGLEQALDMQPEAFMFVAQEKSAPYLAQIYQLDEAARSWGAALNRRAIRKFADCLSSDRWPGYGRDVEMVSLPSYRLVDLERQAEARLLEYAA